MANENDGRLIKEYLSGDEQALELLIKQYLKPIYGFVFRYVNNPADAEDITQEIFFRLWRNLKKFQPAKSFKAWLFTIAKNAAIDFLKKKKTVSFSALISKDNEGQESSIIETLSNPAPLPDELFDRAHLATELTEALSKLPFKYQTVLLMHYQNDLTLQEIAKILHEPLNTVKSRSRRAKVALKEILLPNEMHPKQAFNRIN